MKSELELFKNYNKIRTNFNNMILGCYKNYDEIYEQTCELIDKFIYDLLYFKENAIDAYYYQILDDAKVTSGNLYRYVITAFEDIDWKLDF